MITGENKQHTPLAEKKEREAFSREQRSTIHHETLTLLPSQSRSGRQITDLLKFIPESILGIFCISLGVFVLSDPSPDLSLLMIIFSIVLSIAVFLRIIHNSYLKRDVPTEEQSTRTQQIVSVIKKLFFYGLIMGSSSITAYQSYQYVFNGAHHFPLELYPIAAGCFMLFEFISSGILPYLEYQKRMRYVDSTQENINTDNKVRCTLKTILFTQIISCFGSFAVFIGTLEYTNMRNILPTQGSSFSTFKSIIIGMSAVSLIAKLISVYLKSSIVEASDISDNLRVGLAV